jgi:hypothetical protein
LKVLKENTEQVIPVGCYFTSFILIFVYVYVLVTVSPSNGDNAAMFLGNGENAPDVFGNGENAPMFLAMERMPLCFRQWR